MPGAKVEFLNVGWGDAHFIQLPSGGLCLIDGGDGTFSEDRDHPLSWMNRNQTNRLDWMILTHIHEDHINGLLDVARAKTVVKAVLPYEPYDLPAKQAVHEQGDPFSWRVYEMLASYLDLIQVLTDQGTEIIWRSKYGSNEESVIWSEEGMTLSHLYPWKEDPLPAYDVLMDVHVLENLPRFFELSNYDSSVIRLSSMEEPNASVLFGGDQLEPGWEAIAQRTDIRSTIWKVSHHGMEDGFNSRILSWIQPEHCIIPVCLERSQEFQMSWEKLRSCTNASFYVTGSYAKGKPHFIDNGSVPIRIGF
ncbi:ComEC/Rec2 family competence protein [Paenibacillus planticolens]|uniref:MBL fold metallo-hydrolase n=1 Tax=Paenibacillus planticolens TaxID=2654976 RepID=A0ABX1ZZG0_9BACL|nr:MBL fold metallo-hydrolase [Paenibacillus planticolens]NOV04387.1 MBL fold metallo-hydrolase [Paenibacillus planticolens]